MSSRDGQEALNQEIYRALHTGAFGDLQFYRALIERWIAEHSRAPEVLELGCGSGRILVELARSGAIMTGVDLSASALDYCQGLLDAEDSEHVRADIKLICGDFSRLASIKPKFSDSFDLILITYNSFYCLDSEHLQVELIREALSCLNAKGELWIDGYALPDPDVYAYESDEEFSPLTVITLPPWPSGEPRELGVEERDHFEQGRQKFSVTYRYRAPVGEEAREPLHLRQEVIDHQYVYPWQLPLMCDIAGGSLKRLYADFGGEEVDPQGEIRAFEWGMDAEHWVASIIVKNEGLVSDHIGQPVDA